MNWIETISQGITSAFSMTRAPAPSIPPILLLCEIMNRPGLSAMSLTSAVISRLPEIGIETGANPDGSANMVNQFVKIFSEELVKEINITGVSAGVGGGAVTASNSGFSEVKGLIK